MGKTKIPAKSSQMQRAPAKTTQIAPRPAPMMRQLQPAPEIQRVGCACGGEIGADGECPACRARRETIQRKMTVNQPGDAYEQEADQVARAHVRRQADEPEPVRPSIMRRPTIQRQAQQPSAVPEVTPEIETTIQSARGGGQAMPPDVQRKMEDSLGADLGGVRIHQDSRADQLNRQLDARAFTTRNDIFFKQGEYNPNSRGGQGLLAHELTHTVQQKSRPGSSTEELNPNASSTETLYRGALDPANTAAWDWYGRAEHRKSSTFLPTVAAAGDAAKNLTKQLSEQKAPQTEEERQAFERQVLRLIRLKAVSMIGEHRSSLARNKRDFQDMAAKPTSANQLQGAADKGENTAAVDTAMAIRAAAQSVKQLNADKDTIQGLRSATDSAVRINAGKETIDDEYKTLWEKAQPHSSMAIMQLLLSGRNQVYASGLSWGSQKMRLIDLRNKLLKFRRGQLQAIDASLALVYEAFPFLADLSADTIMAGKTIGGGSTGKALAVGLAVSSLTLPMLLPIAAHVAKDAFKKDKPLDDETLLAEVQKSFDRLLDRTDDAIIKVGSGGMNPLDLPGAVETVRQTLPEPLRLELDRIKKDHEVMKFTKEMFLVLGIAVLSGLTAGAASVGLAGWAAAGGAATAGVGAAQLGGQFKEMMDRQTIGAASTSPDRSLLGVSAPGLFEWAMFGVSAILTVADLGLVAREIHALHPNFKQKPELPPSKPHAAGSKSEPEPTPHPGNKLQEIPEPVPGSKPVQPKNPSEARILEAGRGDAIPSAEQIESELAIVERSKPTKIPGDEYIEEVELANGHTWRRTPDGGWCRFSKGRICVKGGRARTAKETIKTEEDITKLIEPHRPSLDHPPASVKTDDDRVMWNLYNEYFDERVTAIRNDIRASGQTERDFPLEFNAFRKRYTENPKLVAALRGRLSQAEIGNILDEIAGGKILENLGISKVPKPVRGKDQVLFPDFVWQGEHGVSAVSSKSHDFRGKDMNYVKGQLRTDINQAVDNYLGNQFVRRGQHNRPGIPITIDEVILNYDPTLVPKSVQDNIRAIAREFEGTGVKISFFQLK